MALMNQSEYARHRGVSHTAVQKAIKSGRISAAIKGKKIDQVLADRLWVDNTDQAKPLNSITGNPKHRRDPNTPKGPIGSSGGDSAGESVGGGPSYVQARAISAAYDAKLKKLDFETKAGKLIELSAAEVIVFNQARRARDMLFSIPDRISAILAAEDDPRKVYDILTTELRRVADEVSSVRLN